MHWGPALQCGPVVLIRMLFGKGQSWVIGKGASGQPLAGLAVCFGGPGAQRGAYPQKRCPQPHLLLARWSPGSCSLWVLAVSCRTRCYVTVSNLIV